MSPTVLQYLEVGDYFPFIPISVERKRVIDIHFYTDNLPFVFICVKDIDNLTNERLLELENKSHLFVYYSTGCSNKFNDTNTTKEEQLSKLLDIPNKGGRVYIMTPNRRISNIITMNELKNTSWENIQLPSVQVSSNIPLLVINDVLDKELFEEVKTYYEDNKENGDYQQTKTKNRNHVFSSRSLTKKIDNKLSRSLFPEIRKMFNFSVKRRELYKICCYDGDSKGRFHAHRDTPYPQQHRKYAMSLFLTDDYEGGEFELREYGIKIKPKANSAFIFPGICSHMVHPVTKGSRMTIITFFCDSGEMNLLSDYYEEQKLKFSNIYPYDSSMRENAVKDVKKFIINRSSFMAEYLESKGWVRGNVNEKVDFSYWDVVDGKGVKVSSKKQLYPRALTNFIEHKIQQHKFSIKNGMEHFHSATYTDISQVTDKTFKSGHIYFLKDANANGGRGVFVVRSYDEMKEHMKPNKHYLLQEEVPNMYLEDGFKTSLRIHVLIDNKKAYIHKEGKVYIHKELYTRDDTDNRIHNDSYNCSYDRYSNAPYYKKTYSKVEEMCKKFTCAWLETVPASSNDNYHLFGFDFILDKKMTPYMIEVNTYPNVAPMRDVRGTVNKEMLTDLCNFYILKDENAKHGWLAL